MEQGRGVYLPLTHDKAATPAPEAARFTVTLAALAPSPFVLANAGARSLERDAMLAVFFRAS
jgi:hypothetical protein